MNRLLNKLYVPLMAGRIRLRQSHGRIRTQAAAAAHVRIIEFLAVIVLRYYALTGKVGRLPPAACGSTRADARPIACGYMYM